MTKCSWKKCQESVFRYLHFTAVTFYRSTLENYLLNNENGYVIRLQCILLLAVVIVGWITIMLRTYIVVANVYRAAIRIGPVFRRRLWGATSARSRILLLLSLLLLGTSTRFRRRNVTCPCGYRVSLCNALTMTLTVISVQCRTTLVNTVCYVPDVLIIARTSITVLCAVAQCDACMSDDAAKHTTAFGVRARSEWMNGIRFDAGD